RAQFAAALLVAAVGYGGQEKNVSAPRPHGNLAAALSAAYKEEATGDPVKAVELYTHAIDLAGASPEDSLSVPVTMAALDALVHRNVYAFGDVSSTSALVDRI